MGAVISALALRADVLLGGRLLIVIAIGMLTLPESPRWLARHGQAAEAERVLRRLRPPGEDVVREDAPGCIAAAQADVAA